MRRFSPISVVLALVLLSGCTGSAKPVSGKLTLLLQPGVTDSQRDALRAELHGFTELTGITYVSAADAYQRFRADFNHDPSPAQLTSNGNLPESYEATIPDMRFGEALYDALAPSDGVGQAVLGGTSTGVDQVGNITVTASPEPALETELKSYGAADLRYESVADALVRLRKVCHGHAALLAALGTGPVGGSYRFTLTRKQEGDRLSHPSLDMQVLMVPRDVL